MESKKDETISAASGSILVPLLSLGAAYGCGGGIATAPLNVFTPVQTAVFLLLCTLAGTVATLILWSGLTLLAAAGRKGFPSLPLHLTCVTRNLAGCSSRCLILSLVGLLLPLMLAGCQKLPTQAAEFPQMPIRGMTFVDWTPFGYGGSAVESSLRAVAACGVNHLAIVVTAYQSDPASNEIRADSTRTPSPSAVWHAMTLAGSLGLKMAVKVHVDLDDGTWRAQIAPSDPSAWFRSYNDFLLPWAALAEAAGAVQFIIGTELAGTLQHDDLWQETIQSIRSVFSGELVYAACWDGAFRVPFWDSVDHVGVDFYFPVTFRRDPGRFEILSGWEPWLERLQRLHKQTGRKIILTEIGYRSVDGAGMRPFDLDPNRSPDLEEQADLYWAAMQATADIPWVAGMYWWNWNADGSGGLGDIDYTPAGKPAEIELASCWGGDEE